VPYNKHLNTDSVVFIGLRVIYLKQKTQSIIDWVFCNYEIKIYNPNIAVNLNSIALIPLSSAMKCPTVAL
jgi:hypothetical protein